MTDRPEERLRLRLLGGFDARLGGESLDLHLRRADRLLAYLVLRGGRAARGEVAEQLWPGAVSNPEDHALARLRQALGSEASRLEVRRGDVRLDLRGVGCDVSAFDALARRADAPGGEGEEGDVRAAVQAYAGPLLPDWKEPDDRWFVAERARREEQFERLLWQAAILLRRRGAALEAVPYLRRYVARNPLRERGWQALIRALAEAGERMEAAAAYEEYRRALLGHDLAPPPEMERQYRDLLERAAAGSRPSPPSAPPVGGALLPDAPYYVAREADRRFGEALERGEGTVVLKGASQTGKSSLLARALHGADRRGALTLVTDLGHLGRDDFASLETLCLRLAAGLCTRVAGALGTPAVAPEAFFRPAWGPGGNLERLIEGCVFRQTAAPVVWALDGADRLFGTPVQDDFFSLLRAWHNQRALERRSRWRRLTVAIACATEAHLYVRDLDRSPFNVGVRLELADFSRGEAEELNARYGSPLDARAADALYRLLAGHPCLTSWALRAVAAEGAELEEVIQNAAREDGPFRDHLARAVEPVLADRELAAAVRDVRAGRPCPAEAFYRLRTAGILIGPSGDRARVRCELYERYLARKMPAP